MSGRLARAALHGTLLLASSGASLALAELAVRLVLPQYRSIQTDRAMWQHHERLGWTGRPGAQVWQGFDDARKVAVQLNSRGFRDAEHADPPAAGRHRLLVLGDSVAFGYGVGLEQRFTEVIEQARPDVEFVNLGVSGYSTDQELLLFREEGLRYRAEGVILVFVVNDPLYNGQPLGHGHPKPALALRGDALVVENVPVPESDPVLRAKYFLTRNSALFNLVREQLRGAARETGFNLIAGDERLAGASEHGEGDGEELTQRLVEQLRDEVTAAGARFLVLTAITNADLASNQAANVRLLEWCPSRGITCLDTYPSFQREAAAQPDAVLFLQDRSHWSARGHALAARVLLDALLEQGWLLPAPPSHSSKLPPARDGA